MNISPQILSLSHRNQMTQVRVAVQIKLNRPAQNNQTMNEQNSDRDFFSESLSTTPPTLYTLSRTRIYRTNS